jgi:hypothetical protein
MRCAHFAQLISYSWRGAAVRTPGESGPAR